MCSCPRVERTTNHNHGGLDRTSAMVFLPFINGQSEAWQGEGVCPRPLSKELQFHKPKMSLTIRGTLILSTAEKEEKKKKRCFQLD